MPDLVHLTSISPAAQDAPAAHTSARIKPALRFVRRAMRPPESSSLWDDPAADPEAPSKSKAEERQEARSREEALQRAV